MFTLKLWKRSKSVLMQRESVSRFHNAIFMFMKKSVKKIADD